MNLLDLAVECNLSPRKVASTNGGEYKSSCPQCQNGKDRFCIWPNQGESGRYWCRVCNCKGDGIQFCRDFLGMTFNQACQKVGTRPNFQERAFNCNPYKKTKKFTPQLSLSVAPEWQEAAKFFIETSHQKLMNDPRALELLFDRELSIETIQRFFLGWNPNDLFDDRRKWGLPEYIKENGRLKRQWLPRGIVIPTYEKGEPIKVKIRRNNWHPEDLFPKYVEVCGSKRCPSTFGDPLKPVVIIESELDAILIRQYASHLVWCVALGGVSKKPDRHLHVRLKQAPLILLSLDHDEAGKKGYAFWMKLYSNLRPWPTPQGKSPGDGVSLFQVDILRWVRKGLSVL